MRLLWRLNVVFVIAEIGALGEAFERMRKGLDKAMKLIGGANRGA